MNLNSVIFDMDGLLIDSEPWWEEAGAEALQEYGVQLSNEDYHITTGLRTREWIDWWFTHYTIDKEFAKVAEESIVSKAIDKIRQHAQSFNGVDYIFQFFKERKFKIGLATSSPISLIEVVAEKLKIKHHLDAISSAEELTHSKPHPQVYLNCAETLGVSPMQCICFEDTFNGMIAAKGARMKCVIIPLSSQFEHARWGAADLKLEKLSDFTDKHLSMLEK